MWTHCPVCRLITKYSDRKHSLPCLVHNVASQVTQQVNTAHACLVFYQLLLTDTNSACMDHTSGGCNIWERGVLLAASEASDRIFLGHAHPISGKPPIIAGVQLILQYSLSINTNSEKSKYFIVHCVA